MRNLAPHIVRQRLLIEACYQRSLTQEDVALFLRKLPEALNLRIYSEPVVYSPAGEGQEANQGYDGFVALIDSGISIYVWEQSRFLSVVIYTCKSFDVPTALQITHQFFETTDMETLSF